MHEGLSICHWDIKPQNIFIDSNFDVKLGDFGISKYIKTSIEGEENEENLTKSTSTGFAGTLQYMAPEIAKKRTWHEKFSYDPFKADMWSLGVTIY